jgi:hypothetical protein
MVVHLLLLGSAFAYESAFSDECGSLPPFALDLSIASCRYEFLSGPEVDSFGWHTVPEGSIRDEFVRGLQGWSTSANVGGGFDLYTEARDIDRDEAAAIRDSGGCLIGLVVGSPMLGPSHPAETEVLVSDECNWRGADIVVRRNGMRVGNPTAIGMRGFSVAATVMHEIGHAFGFAHNEEHLSVMNHLQHTGNTSGEVLVVYGDEFQLLVDEYPDGDLGENYTLLPMFPGIERTLLAQPFVHPSPGVFRCSALDGTQSTSASAGPSTGDSATSLGEHDGDVCRRGATVDNGRDDRKIHRKRWSGPHDRRSATMRRPGLHGRSTWAVHATDEGRYLRDGA